MTLKKILLADDEEDLRTVLGLYLQSKQYDVITAYDGLNAIDLAKSQKPDLILLDVMMPVLNGFEVCKRLKADPETSSIPVIFVSAAGQPESKELGFKAGAVGYLVKPFEPKELDVILERALASEG
ncbi:MAG: response regulator [bacterium]